jgi:hypothetical protein
VLAKYIQAIGGQAALDKVTARVEHGQAVMPQGGAMPITVYHRWTLGRPSGSFTIQIDKVEQNVPIDDAVFVEPKFAPPGATPGHAPPDTRKGPNPPQGAAPPSGTMAPPPSGM